MVLTWTLKIISNSSSSDSPSASPSFQRLWGMIWGMEDPLGISLRWSSILEPCICQRKSNKSSSGSLVWMSSEGPLTEFLTDVGRDERWSSRRWPWHFDTISKKPSSTVTCISSVCMFIRGDTHFECTYIRTWTVWVCLLWICSVVCETQPIYSQTLCKPISSIVYTGICSLGDYQVYSTRLFWLQRQIQFGMVKFSTQSPNTPLIDKYLPLCLTHRCYHFIAR